MSKRGSFKPLLLPLATFAALGAAALAYAAWVRPRMLRWGASANEATQPLPGDHLVPAPRTSFTRAITLRAAPAQVWPWLVQIGSHRAGWYSYDDLDNGGVPSAASIQPEFQDLKVGDEIWAASDGTLAFAVNSLEPERALVLSGPLDFTTAYDERRGLWNPFRPARRRHLDVSCWRASSPWTTAAASCTSRPPSARTTTRWAARRGCCSCSPST